MNFLRFTTLSSLLLFSFGSQAQADIKQLTVVIDQPKFEYVVEVDGTLDPQNIEIAIENTGDTPVVNPRMTVNGLYDWYDAKSMADEITRDCSTDEEKALAIWWWVRYRTYQRSPYDGSVHHPVRALNGYGYGICSHVASWMKCLWTGAGLRARIQELWGHTVSEVYYNGAWHLLDGNAKVFYLDRDNHGIASLSTLEHDKWLIERTIHPREWSNGFSVLILPTRNQDFVRYIISHKDNYEENGYDSEISKDYSMAMTLKPGEKLVRWWSPSLAKYEGRDVHAEVPQLFANGQLIWEPDLRHMDIRPYLSISNHGNITTKPEMEARQSASLICKMNCTPGLLSLPSPFKVLTP